jgi:uncharacterized OsmC-like protein
MKHVGEHSKCVLVLNRVSDKEAGTSMHSESILKYEFNARRIDARGSIAISTCAQMKLQGNHTEEGDDDAFNPVEFLIATVAARMVKGIERVGAALQFQLEGVQVRIHGKRRGSLPKMVDITYELIVDTQEPEHRLAVLHKDVRNYIAATVAAAVTLVGTIRRAHHASLAPLVMAA